MKKEKLGMGNPTYLLTTMGKYDGVAMGEQGQKEISFYLTSDYHAPTLL